MDMGVSHILDGPGLTIVARQLSSIRENPPCQQVCPLMMMNLARGGLHAIS